ncbi:MAG: glycoside hydrolase family 9 protein [Elusimicrobia bacterium]|nr:glycoside hydrolase family 9 protein [Elusimicrobiota bacterium]
MRKAVLLVLLVFIVRVALFSVDIDNLDFNRVFLSEPEDKILIKDDFENIEDWTTSSDGKAIVNISQGKGKDDNCLKMTYDLRNKGEWCLISKKIDIDDFKKLVVLIYVKSKRTDHVFEVKLIDKDGGVFGHLITMDARFKDWTKIILGPDDIEYLWGGEDKKLDNIKSVEFAVNGRNHYEQGEVLIDSFKLYEFKEDFAECTLSQVGYHRDDKKYAVLRICSDRKLPDNIKYNIIDTDTGKSAYNDSFAVTDFNRWKGNYYKADFSKLQDYGTYKLEVEIIPGHKLATNKFDIDKNVLYKNITPKVYHFINFMRCGKNCHKQDPVPGGYHDTFFDIGKRMWSLTHIIVGMVMTIKNAPDLVDIDNNKVDDRIEELIYALDFALNVQLPDGGVGSFGIGHKESVDTSKFTFAEDTNPRILDNTSDINTTCYYAGALAKSYTLLKDGYPELSARLLDSVIRAWKYLDSQNIDTSYGLGGYIYASTELYKITKDKKYLKRILENLKKLQKLQDLDCSNKESYICGDFFLSESKKEYEYQYKFFEYNLEIFLGLVNVCNLFDYQSEEWLKSMYILRVFKDIYIKRMASLTPYDQIAHGLEKVDGKYDIAFFPPPDQPWTGAHGFNCDHFSYSYLAMLIGYLTGDLSSEEFADNQMQWVLGNNPLRYCMISGVGYNNPVVMSMTHNKGGPIDGGIPNGLVGYKLPFPIWLSPAYNSGEYWLPHNAYYLVLSALLDTEPRVSGRVIGKNKGKVDVYYDDKLVKSLNLDNEGSFGTVNLEPEKKYLLKYSDNREWVLKNVSMLSGDNKYVTLNPKGEYEIKIKVLKNKNGKAKVEFEIINMSSVKLRPELLIKTYDGVEITEESTNVLIRSSESRKIERKYKLENGSPLIVSCNDKTLLLPFK